MKKLLILSCIFLFTACNFTQKRSEIHSFSNHVWNKFESVTFVQQFDKKCRLEMKLKALLSTDYEYADLKLQYEWISPDGESKLNYVSLPLMNEKGEKVLVNKDGLLEVEAVLSKKEFVNSPGKYTLIVDNMMPQYNTNSVVSLNLELNVSDY